jgi:hypothetical protein
VIAQAVRLLLWTPCVAHSVTPINSSIYHLSMPLLDLAHLNPHLL